MLPKTEQVPVILG